MAWSTRSVLRHRNVRNEQFVAVCTNVGKKARTGRARLGDRAGEEVYDEVLGQSID